MLLNRIILILITLCLLSACAANSTTDSHEPSQASKQQESSIDDELKQLELKAFLNKRGTVSLRIENHSVHNVDNILVGLRMRFSARIVSNFIYTVPEGIKAGASLVVDTEFAIPNERSIIRAEIIKAKFAP